MGSPPLFPDACEPTLPHAATGLAVVYSRARNGMGSQAITVETHLSNGLPQFCIVGLPETAVKESRDRVRSALLNAGFTFPVRRITVNLAPADLPKESGRYDLPIALGILAASGQIPHARLDHYEWVGELALSGALRPIASALPLVVGCQQAGRIMVLPTANAQETAIRPDWKILGADHLHQVVAHIHNHTPLSVPTWSPVPPLDPYSQWDLADVKGQFQAKRALEIAAAGGHHVLLCGPPGTGKTLLAQRLVGLLPPLTEEESLEVAVLQALGNTPYQAAHYGVRPFRSPHHTASGVALVGGGTHPKPGEISLAHRGVLFLDELPEYPRKVLDMLREPLEAGKIWISRAGSKIEFPAQFQLIAAMNPCPCGHYGDPRTPCRCHPSQIKRYHSRLSGPLLDRLDVYVEVPALPPAHLEPDHPMPPDSHSAAVRARVDACHQHQRARQGYLNAALIGSQLDSYAPLQPQARQLLIKAFEKWHLSARSYHRIIRIARTIADLQAHDMISDSHIIEALGYRRIDPHTRDAVPIVRCPDPCEHNPS